MSDLPLPGPPVSTLRVYEPLDAFPAAERRWWQEYLEGAPSNDEVALHERRDGWRRVVAGAKAAVPAAETALARVVRLENVPLLCPVQLRLRCAAAAREASRTLPPAVVSAALSPDAGSADARAGDPYPDPADRRLRSLVAAWDVPWAWLALARPQDRAPGPEGAYLVAMGAARSRAARALKALRDGGVAGDLRDEMEDVARWLEDFHARSAVELDHRPITALLGDVGAEDVRLGLEALAAGETVAVAAAYRRITARGQQLRLLSRCS